MINFEKSEFYIDKRLAKQLDILINNVVKYDSDCLIVFDGKEGAGKSILKQQVGKYISYRLKSAYRIDSQFTVNNIIFNLLDYIKKSMDIFKLGFKYYINDLDESRALANRKTSRSKDSILYTNYLSECRDLNQFHLLALPSYHDLDPNIVKHRMNLLINVRKELIPDENELGGYKIKRGDFRVYSVNHSLIYYYDNPYLKYKYPQMYDKNSQKTGANYFQAKFTLNDPHVIDLDLYKKLKFEARLEKFDPSSTKNTIGEENLVEFKQHKIPIFIFKNLLKRHTQKTVAGILEVSLSTIERLVREIKDKKFL